MVHFYPGRCHVVLQRSSDLLVRHFTERTHQQRSTIGFGQILQPRQHSRQFLFLFQKLVNTGSSVRVEPVQRLASPGSPLQVPKSIPRNCEEVALHGEFPDSPACQPDAKESIRSDVVSQRAVATQKQREPPHRRCIFLVETLEVHRADGHRESTSENTKRYIDLEPFVLQVHKRASLRTPRTSSAASILRFPKPRLRIFGATFRASGYRSLRSAVIIQATSHRSRWKAFVTSWRVRSLVLRLVFA